MIGRIIILALAVLISAPVVSAGAASSAAVASPVIAAVGDIACPAGSAPSPTQCQQAAVAARIEKSPARSVWLLGDIQYPTGAPADFRSSFARSWRAVLPLARPTPGNHEYMTAGAAGYFDFFGRRAGPARRGYYSFDIGRWHVVSLNSNCTIISCAKDSSQSAWLRRDLERHRHRCTAAFWHAPRYSSGSVHGDDPSTRPLWRILQRHRAEFVLGGHDHDFEGFRRQDADGHADRRGMQQFVVGTGGRSQYPFKVAAPNSIVRRTNTFGFLQMKLMPQRFSWKFVDVGGRSLASGKARCR